MNDPLNQLIGAVVNFVCYRDMYRTDAERTAVILKALRQRLYRAEFDLDPKIYVQCVYDAGERAMEEPDVPAA